MPVKFVFNNQLLEVWMLFHQTYNSISRYEDKEFSRLGGTQDKIVDTRVIAATNADLSKKVRGGSFRKDLFYRLSVFPIEISPLRDRREDVALLAEHFVAQVSREMNLPRPRQTSEAVSALSSYDWPGNIRELRHVIERVVLFCDDEEIDLGHLPPDIQASASKPSKKSTRKRKK